jgi:type I restriction enzyme S subunit
VEFESLGELPTDWRWRQLQDLAADPRQDIVDGPFGSNLKASEYVDEGVPIARLQNVDRNQFIDKNIRCVTEAKAAELARHRFQPGDILLTKLGDPLGKACIVPPAIGGGVIVADLVRIRPDLGRVDRKYLTYALNSPEVIRQLERHTKGTTRPRVNLSVVRELPIPVAPRHEQDAVVAEIEKQFSRLDGAVADLKRVKANLKRYTATVLKAAVEGRLVPTEADLARHEGRSYETGTALLQRIVAQRQAGRSGAVKRRPPADPDTAQLPSVPDGWVYCSVSQVCDVASGNTPAGVLDAVRPSGALPWFKVGDMNHADNQQVMHHADSWLSEADAKALGLRIFPSRTLLFPKRGGAIATNKKRVLDQPGCADLNVMGITPCEAIDEYFRVWFDSVDLGKLSDGSNVPQINHKDIAPLPLPLPPRAEQDRIVAEVDRRLSIVREVEAEVDANLRRALSLRHAVLARAFAG